MLKPPDELFSGITIRFEPSLSPNAALTDFIFQTLCAELEIPVPITFVSCGKFREQDIITNLDTVVNKIRKLRGNCGQDR